MMSPSHTWLEFSDGRRVDLFGTIHIGRAAENDLILDHAQVSRRHAILQAQGEGEHWLVDLGSANGTYLNGRRVSSPQQLKSDDVIEIGGIAFRFGTGDLTTMHPAGRQLLASTQLEVKTARVWMLMADIVNSTRLAQELPEEELPRLTGEWFRLCHQVIDDCGGNMMKYLGDGFFCYWMEGEKTRLQVRTALYRLKLMQDQASPAFRVVLHHGSAVLGSVPTMAEVNLHGQEVNYTFRIEKIAGALRVPLMFSEAAKNQLGIECVHVSDESVTGFNGKHAFYAPMPLQP
jgi:adenylate cyclase